VDGVWFPRHGSEAATRQQCGYLLRPVSADERVSVAVDDEGRLFDHRQPVLDAIGQNSAGRREQDSTAGRQIVAGRQREQGKRLTSRRPERAEQLMSCPASRWIDGRADEDDRPRQCGPARGKLRHNLAAHRIGDERRAGQTLCFHPGAQCRGQPGDAHLPL